MTPEEVGQWLASHGGPAGGEGPDANGRIVQRAADGSYIVQQTKPGGSVEVVDTHEAAPPSSSSPDATPTPAPPPPGSGSVSQTQLEALLKQVAPNGDPRRLEFNQGTKDKQIRVPGTLGGPDTTRTIQTPYVQWVDRATGQTLEADVSPNGDGYTVTFNGVKKENQGTQATTPAQTQAQKPGKDSRPVATHPGYYTVTTTDPENNTSETHYEDASGNRVEKLPPTAAEAQANAPKPIKAEDGTYGYWDTSGPSPKWVPIQSGPQATKTPVKVGDQYGYWDQSSGAPKWVAIEGPPMATGQAEPAGAPEIGATPQELAEGAKAYSKWLAQQVELYRTTGGKQGVAPDKASSLMQARLALMDKLADVAQNTVSTQATQRGQDITQRGQSLSDTASRRSAAQSIYDTHLSQYLPMLKYAGKGGGGLVFDAMQESLGNARAYVDSYGGMRESPEVGAGQFPALQQARQASLATVQQAANPQQIFQPRPLTGAAIGPVANGVTATNAAAIAPTGPNVQAATDATMQGANAAFGALGVPPVPPAPSPTPAAVNPVNQQAITMPQTPEVTPPPPVVPEPEPVGMQPPGQSPMFMTQARFGQQYNPQSIVQRLMQDPSMDNNILAQAYAEMYGQPMPV